MVGPGLIGRETEWAELSGLLAGRGGARGMVISGPAGVGKTTLLRTVVAEALTRGCTVLSTVASAAESRLSYAGLADWLGDVLDGVLDTLPAPQAQALLVALRRAGGRPVDAHTVYAGLLSVLRALAARSPVLLAVDDLQWVDAPSARALAFAVRRLGPEPVMLIATRRLDGPATEDIAAGLGPAVTVLPVGPLGRDALAQLVQTVGGPLPVSLVYRICDGSGGNPLVALELTRAVRRFPVLPMAGEPLPVPEDIGMLVWKRLSHLSRAARRLLLLLAAGPQPRLPSVCQAFGDLQGASEALDELTAAGVVAVHAEHVEFGHPLYGSVCYARALPGQRADAHRRLAQHSIDPEERSRHLALASEGPDEGVAALLEEASGVASGRGAPDTAAELLRLALQLTPDQQPADAARRMVAAGTQLIRAGDWPAGRSLLRAAADRAPEAPLRAQALLALAWGSYRDDGPVVARQVLLDAQTAVAAGPLPLRAAVYRALAWMDLVGGSVGAGLGLARTAATLAEQAGDDQIVSDALTAFCMAEFAKGDGLDEALLARACRLGVVDDPCNAGVWAGVLRMWAGDHEGALQLVGTLARARQRGDETVAGSASYWLAELEWRRGNWDQARRYLDDWAALAQAGGARLAGSLALALRAYLLAASGDTDGARRSATEALALSAGSGNRHPVALSKAALGFVELTAGDWPAAADALQGLRELLDRDGVVDPGIYLFAADEVEACLGAGRLDRAVTTTTWLRAAAERTNRPWGVAMAARCEGLLAAAGAGGQVDLPTALDRLGAALEAQEELDMPFEHGRTLLLLGTAQRRARRGAEGRRSLQAAGTVFDQLGARPWAARATAELQLVGGRRPAAAGRLTTAEHRVARLAAGGLRNREIARTLFLSEKTVESTLSHVYTKLGIRSRTELARLVEAVG